jgi:hypothetical protein
MLSRFRSAWLSQIGSLLVLRLLRESALSEFEILSRLHTRYGLTPNAREFGRLIKTLLGQGFVRLESGLGGNELQITTAGNMLLSQLEEEYRAVVSNIMRSQGGSYRAVSGSQTS